MNYFFSRHRLLLVVSIVSLAFIAHVGVNFMVYYYADSLYDSIAVSEIRSREQLETILKFCKPKQIEMKDSKWGNHITLATNQICIQYQVLGFPSYPIDVIFEEKTNAIRIISSYE